MNAVIVQVKIDANREEEMRTVLNQEVVPTARQLPGFASGPGFRPWKATAGPPC
jgi:hypothetical protein